MSWRPSNPLRVDRTLSGSRQQVKNSLLSPYITGSSLPHLPLFNRLLRLVGSGWEHGELPVLWEGVTRVDEKEQWHFGRIGLPRLV